MDSPFCIQRGKEGTCVSLEVEENNWKGSEVFPADFLDGFKSLDWEGYVPVVRFRVQRTCTKH